jgi:hypothetical protein
LSLGSMLGLDNGRAHLYVIQKEVSFVKVDKTELFLNKNVKI